VNSRERFRDLASVRILNPNEQKFFCRHGLTIPFWADLSMRGAVTHRFFLSDSDEYEPV
jgi:hypothetical protein